jgi:hypothetical protein
MSEHTEDKRSSPPYGLLGFALVLLVPVVLVLVGQFEVVSSDLPLSGTGVAVFGVIVGAGGVLVFQDNGLTRQTGAAGVVALLFLSVGVAIGAGVAPATVELLGAVGVVLLGTVVLVGAVPYMLTAG